MSTSGFRGKKSVAHKRVCLYCQNGHGAFPLTNNSVFQFPNRSSSLRHFRTIDARLTTGFPRFSQLTDCEGKQATIFTKYGKDNCYLIFCASLILSGLHFTFSCPLIEIFASTDEALTNKGCNSFSNTLHVACCVQLIQIYCPSHHNNKLGARLKIQFDSVQNRLHFWEFQRFMVAIKTCQT